MGMRLFRGGSSACKSFQTNPTYAPPEPDPKNFRVLEEMVIGGRSILLVYYPGCTTFEGKKLLLLKFKWNSNSTEILDPHLLGGKHPVIARFEPNEQGWALAKACARML